MKHLTAIPGINLNTLSNGDSALTIAHHNIHATIVRFLLNTPGINDTAVNAEEENALIWAARFGYTDLVKIILATPGTNVNAVSKYNNNALIAATTRGHIGIVNLLLATPGIIVKAVNTGNDNAFIRAAANGHTDIVKILLPIFGTDISAANNDGNNALMFAAARGHIDIINILLPIYGTNVNAVNKNGDSALIIAAENEKDLAIKALFASLDIDVNITNTRGFTALTSAIYYYTRHALLDYYAKWLLTAKKEDVTTQILDQLKPHKEALYQILTELHDKFNIMKTIVNEKEKDATAIGKVFWYKNSTLKKGRLGDIYQEYLDYINANEGTTKHEEVIAIPDIKTNDLAASINTAIAKSDFKTIVTLLFANKDKTELTTATLELLKPLKEHLFTQIKKLNPAELLQAVKQIFEGKNTTALGAVFWYINSTLSSGRLATFYETYKLMIEIELLTMKDKDLTPANIQFISEYINSESAFKLDDQLVNTVLWKWLNQTNVTQLTTSGKNYLKQYKEQFLAIDKTSASSIALNQLLVEEKLPTLSPSLFNRFISAAAEASNNLFKQSATKETAAQYQGKL